MTHSLTLGSLLLTDAPAHDEHGYSFSVLAEGTGFGVAQGVREVVTSLLADGDIVRTTRFGNREVSFPVQIEGPTLGSLAHGEAALRAEVGRRNTLMWQAPDVLSVPTVFEVVDSEMQQTFNDLDELRRKRTFILTLTCSPFARSADAVTVPALISGGVASSTVVDTCDSATGWSAAMNGVSAGVSTTWETGAVSVVDLGAPTPSLLTLTRTGTISFSTQRYLVIEAGFSPSLGAVPIYAYAGTSPSASEIPKVSQQQISPGWFRCIFDQGGTSLSAVTFSGYFTPENADLKIRDVSKRNQPGTVPRQQTKIIAVGGTERTPTNLHVQTANGADPLGQCIVHTCPEDGSGYSPPLQRWRTVGQTRTNDATAFSGTYESINTTSWVAEVPTLALPEGGYVLMARLRAQSAATVTVTWSTSTIFPDASTQEGFTVGTVQHTFAAGNVWELVKMEALTLPSVRTKSGKVQIALQVAAASPVVTLDEAWLFREDDDCALTIVETPRPHVWLDSPGLDSSVPRVWIGSGMTTKVHPGTGLKAMGAHVLSPEGTAVFTAALSDFPATDATFYRRWHSNAAS